MSGGRAGEIVNYIKFQWENLNFQRVQWKIVQIPGNSRETMGKLTGNLGILSTWVQFVFLVSRKVPINVHPIFSRKLIISLNLPNEPIRNFSTRPIKSYSWSLITIYIPSRELGINTFNYRSVKTFSGTFPFQK